ncbi:D-inositol-3-phosphate glycosyltransferase [Moorella thermoacetica]|uniref:D-inositol-3-phosphate glycosyltransferase n=1 Tax=Neomoorella thermoacetica TaxID=1525 RepID=A0A1J5JR67_NEOTH|nr:glycosyltransferase [Moorella thermoacetica]OIQ07952.1 D-inositol-3-phosphate glycosyltransferase [Moorella thermoacetica]
MKIAWFSPLPPLKSGISEYSELILYHLKNYADVDLWVDGFSPHPHICRDFRVINYAQERKVLPLLKTYDAIVYNMGNNAEFHSGMYEVLKEYAGIVILHDYILHHFFAGYWINKKGNPEGYLQEVRRQYGPEVEELAKKSLQPLAKQLWETEEVQRYPLNKSVLEKAAGVVVHSEFVKALLEGTGMARKILKLNSPYYPVPASSLKKTREELHLPKDKVIFASMGFIVPFKRLDKVLQVIASNDFLRKNVFVLVIGEGTPNYQLEKMAENLGLTGQVKFLGYLPIEEAYAYLNCADVCLNLRYPSMGETSGSLIRIMCLGKPAVVSNVGWYSELPDDCAVKINPGNEAEELAIWLRRLALDSGLRSQMGEAARKYVLKEHSPEAFVKGLLNFARSVTTIDPEKMYMRLLDVVTDVMVELGRGAELLLPLLPDHLIWMRT